MSLVICRACGKDISPKATLCPNCGHTYSRGAAAETWKRKDANEAVWLGMLILLVLVCSPLILKFIWQLFSGNAGLSPIDCMREATSSAGDFVKEIYDRCERIYYR